VNRTGYVFQATLNSPDWMPRGNDLLHCLLRKKSGYNSPGAKQARDLDGPLSGTGGDLDQVF